MIIKLLLAALASSSCSAWAAPAGQAVVLSTEAANLANQRLSAHCAKSAGLDELLASPARRSDLATSPFDEVRDLTEYSVCRDLQAAPGACAALEGTKASAAHCTTLAAEARFAFATLRGGDALAACRAVMALDGQRGPAVDRSCAILIKAVRDGDVAGSCPALEREKIITPENTCADIQAMWSGSSQDCARYRDSGTRRECVARAALVSGLREPARCPSSPACQAVSSKPGACDGLRSQVSRNMCARVAKDLAAAAALDPKQRAQVEAQAKEKGAKATAARVAAAAAAVAAEKAKVDAAAAKAKAETLAAQEKIAKMAAADAARRGEANASVVAKAEAEAKKQEKAKADALKKPVPQFRKGAPMVTLPQDAANALKAMEEGRPAPKPKAKPKKQETPPADQ